MLTSSKAEKDRQVNNNLEQDEEFERLNQDDD